MAAVLATDDPPLCTRRWVRSGGGLLAGSSDASRSVRLHAWPRSLCQHRGEMAAPPATRPRRRSLAPSLARYLASSELPAPAVRPPFLPRASPSSRHVRPQAQPNHPELVDGLQVVWPRMGLPDLRTLDQRHIALERRRLLRHRSSQPSCSHSCPLFRWHGRSVRCRCWCTPNFFRTLVN